MGQVEIIEAYSRLKALKANVPGPYVHPKYVEEFHHILDLLEKASGASLGNFRIPASEIRPVITSVSYIGEGATYSDEPYCERAFFDMRVDGVLTMFELLINSGGGSKPPIGFNPRTQ
jgi:hypothetical protein